MSRPMSRRRDLGQGSIELAVMVPLFIFISLLLIQGITALIGLDAANKAARDGALAQSRGQSTQAAVERSLPDWLELRSVRSTPCADSCVSVRVGIPIGLPALNVGGHIVVERDASFARED